MLTIKLQNMYTEMYIEKARAQREKARAKTIESQEKKYGTTEKSTTARCAALNAEKKHKERVAQLLEEIAAASLSPTPEEINTLIARVFAMPDCGMLFPFEGDQGMAFNEKAAQVQEALCAIIARIEGANEKMLEASLDTARVSDHYLRIMTAQEYRACRDTLKYIGFGLYGKGLKFKAADVAALCVFCIKVRKNTLSVASTKTTLKACVVIVNAAQARREQVKEEM